MLGAGLGRSGIWRMKNIQINVEDYLESLVLYGFYMVFIWFYMFFIEDLGVSAMILDGVLSTLIWRGTIQSQI